MGFLIIFSYICIIVHLIFALLLLSANLSPLLLKMSYIVLCFDIILLQTFMNIYNLWFLLLLLSFWDMFSHYSLEWPVTHYSGQAGFKLMVILLPQPTLSFKIIQWSQWQVDLSLHWLRLTPLSSSASMFHIGEMPNVLVAFVYLPMLTRTPPYLLSVSSITLSHLLQVAFLKNHLIGSAYQYQEIQVSITIVFNVNTRMRINFFFVLQYCVLNMYTKLLQILC